MPLNLGYIEGACADGDVIVRVYYDNTQPASETQPLINGPRGWCLDVTNTSGRKAIITISGTGGAPITATVSKGDPVTSGAARSRTAAQMASAGYATRGSVGNFQIEC